MLLGQNVQGKKGGTGSVVFGISHKVGEQNVQGRKKQIGRTAKGGKQQEGDLGTHKRTQG